MSENPPGLSLLKRLQAAELLKDFPIIGSLQSLKSQATYKGVQFADYIDKIQNEIHTIPEMALWAEVDLGNASHYLTELTRSHEAALDGINRVQIDVTCFLGRVRTIHTKAKSLQAPFQALWTIGAGDILQGTPLAKLSAKDLTALATMEFTNLLDEADLEWAAVIETAELIIDNLKAMRKLAIEKYSMGKDQVNAALSEMDLKDAGLEGHPSATRPSSTAGVETLRGMFGDRVQQPEQAHVEETDADLPPDLRDPVVDLDDMPPEPAEPEFPDVDSAEEAPGPEPEITPEAVQTAVEADALVLTTEGPKAAEDLQVGDTALIVGMDLGLDPGVQAVASVVASRDLALTKPKKGEALVVPFNLDIQAPGTLHVADFIIGKGKTKFELIHQDNSEENGVYRFMGPDAPLARIDAGHEAPKAEPTQEPPAEHPQPVRSTIPVDLPAVAQRTEPGTLSPEAKILADPFLGAAKAQEVVDAIKQKAAGDDLPPEEVATPAPEAALDDDLPPEVPETTAAAPAEPEGDDLPPEVEDLPGEPTVAVDGDDFPPDGEPVDRTKASHEPAEGLDEETPAPEPEAAPEVPKAEEPKVEETPKPQKVQVATAVPPKPVASQTSVPKPGGLFRSRVVPPGQAAAPAFRPAAQADAPAVSTDDLGELM